MPHSEPWEALTFKVEWKDRHAGPRSQRKGLFYNEGPVTERKEV